MSKITRMLMAVLLVLGAGKGMAQVTITNITNQNIKTILETYFLGDGVKIDTTHAIYYNNQTIINNNQIGTFVNTDTSSKNLNIPITSGLILATTACKNIAGGSESTQNIINGAQTYAPSLYIAYQNFVNNSELNLYNCTMDGGYPDKFNNIAVLDFWVIPQSCKMSFKYCFGSEEYPNYVCTQYNDFFGLFCDGPYDDNGDPYTNGGTFYSNPTNIAIIPGTYEEEDFESGTPVMINTVNNGNSNSSCGIKNQKYFLDNRKQKCKSTSLTGYTKRLETAVVQTVPNKKYHIQIAICNINDQALQSAVFLEANSFTAEKINIEHNMTQTANNAGYKTIKQADGSLDYIFMKGCTTDTMILKANYVGKANEDPFTFLVQPSNGSSIARGVDFDYYKINDDGTVETVPASNMVTLNEGDTMARFLLTFLHNENKACGVIDTLLLISTDCNNDPVDTAYYYMQEPCALDVEINGGMTICHNELPLKDTISLSIESAVSYAYVSATRGENTIYSDTMKANVMGDDTLFVAKIPVQIMNTTDTGSVKVHVEDFCGREFDTVITYEVIMSQTKATASSVYICEGDSVELSCPTAESYTWTASPKDSTLLVGDKYKSQELVVKPQQNTWYKITAVSEEGCISSDSIKVQVEKLVRAEMEVKPKKVYYSNPEITYSDLSNDPTDREWYFGDGSTSESKSGTYIYGIDTSEDSHTYPITLIVYNKAQCPDTITDSVLVIQDFSLWMPTAFIPGDEREEMTTFGPKGKLIKEYELSVFTRWGTKIFEGKNKHWDGRLENGDYAPQGTYVYHLIYKDGNNLPQRKSGAFTLLPDND